MWVQLTGAVSVAALAVAAAPGGPQVGSRVDVYTDDWITVVSPSAEVSADATDDLRVRARFAADAISGATYALKADAVTSATTFEEHRWEAGASTTWSLSPEARLGVSWSMSEEPDYHTQTVGLSGAVELRDRTLTLEAAWAASFERVGSVDQPTLSEPIRGQALDLSATWILGPGTVLTTLASGSAYWCGDTLGCHANPYRYVPLEGVAGTIAASVPERHPDDRLRGALGLRLSQHLGAGVALHLGYRLYGDTWRVRGHTGSLDLARGFLADRLQLRLRSRLSHQRGATFWREPYGVDPGAPAVPAYRTSDRELMGLVSGMAGVTVEWTVSPLGPLDALRIGARASRLWFRYRDHEVLPRRDAWVAGGGVDATF